MFVTPLPDDDNEPLRYHMMENILDKQPTPEPVQCGVDKQLHLAHDDSKPHSFAEAEKDAAWRVAMKLKMDSVEQNHTWELVDLPADHRALP